MIAGVQIIGILFSLVMIYLTYVYYKRGNYSVKSFFLWLAVWIGTLVLIGRPETAYGVMEALQIERTADFIVMAGFTFFSVVIFHMYVTVKKTNQKTEELVRKIATQKSSSKKKK